MTRGMYCVLLTVVLFVPMVAVAQTSPLYLTSYYEAKAYVMQNGVIIDRFWRQHTHDGPALAVTDTIKMFGFEEGSSGYHYTLGGDLIPGDTYTNPCWPEVYDATSDGVNNYARQCYFEGGKAIVVGDSDWGGLHEAFEPAEDGKGIAYDGVTDSLWLTRGQSIVSGIDQYDLAGNLLFGFDLSASIEDAMGLAWDPADDTLWLAVYGGQLNQYDKQGNHLQTLIVPEGITGICGAEFSVPEPGTLSLLALGVAGVLRRRR